MSKVLVRIRVLPVDVSIDLKELGKRISDSLKGIADVVRTLEEPIAFGLNALIVDLVMDEREGGTYDLEQVLSSVDGIGELDIVRVSLLSGA
ncbi:MAG: elongation factor 1-beta [Nitrososphaeria archaeon]|jgi:elongation factor 1-beta